LSATTEACEGSSALVIADWSLFGCSDYIDKPTAIEPIRLPVELHRLCTFRLAKSMNPITNFLKPRLAQSHTTVVIPLYKRVVSLVCSTVPNSPVGFPKLAKPSTRSPGFSSESGAVDWTSGGLLARSESAVAPACDRGCCGALCSFDIRLLIRLMFHYPSGLLRLVHLLDN
jgi:hypothetical protein